MNEHKNPLLEDLDLKKEDKIGFDNAVTLAKHSKNEEKYPDNFEGKGLRKAAKLVTVFGIIFAVIAMMYYLLPLFAAVIGALLAVCIVLFMVCSVVFTLGIALMNDGYRNWIGNDMMDVPNFFFKIGDNIAKLAPYYLVVAIPALVLTIAGFVLGIVGTSKHYRFFASYIVLNAIFLTLTLISMTIYFVSGMNVFNA